MKTMAEIRDMPRVVVQREGADGGQAEVYLLTSRRILPATVIFSWGGGWDHVSVSFPHRTPTWEEMAEIKRTFFRPEEVAFELHPIESEYVNTMPYCLHIWRPQRQRIPVPPRIFV